MKLRKRRDERPPVEVRARLSAEVHDDLRAYADLYEETYQKPIDPKELIADIVLQFLSSDRSFRQWKRRQRAGASNDVSASNGELRA